MIMLVRFFARDGNIIKQKFGQGELGHSAGISIKANSFCLIAHLESIKNAVFETSFDGVKDRTSRLYNN